MTRATKIICLFLLIATTIMADSSDINQELDILPHTENEEALLRDSGESRHWIEKIMLDGHYIEIEDGSKWLIDVWDSSDSSEWLPSDIVVITLYENEESSFKYLLNNLTRDNIVKANLVAVPDLDNPYSTFIKRLAVDWDAGKITILLNNDETFIVPAEKAGQVQFWSTDESVIVGVDKDDEEGYLLVNSASGDIVRAYLDL